MLDIFIVMNKSKKELNPKLVVGDRIMCLHMDGEISVPIGTTGKVNRVSRDPFEVDSDIISVDWDNGSKLSLLTATDSWIKTDEGVIKESSEVEFFTKNPEVFENFDYKFLRDYIMKLRDSSVINMFQSPPFLYSGKEWIDRYYGENQEDNEAFQEVLEMADESKDKMIQGVLKYMEANDMEIDLNRINILIRKFAYTILKFYISFF
jgi:hypothetical protein